MRNRAVTIVACCSILAVLLAVGLSNRRNQQSAPERSDGNFQQAPVAAPDIAFDSDRQPVHSNQFAGSGSFVPSGQNPIAVEPLVSFQTAPSGEFARTTRTPQGYPAQQVSNSSRQHAYSSDPQPRGAFQPNTTTGDRYPVNVPVSSQAGHVQTFSAGQQAVASIDSNSPRVAPVGTGGINVARNTLSNPEPIVASEEFVPSDSAVAGYASTSEPFAPRGGAFVTSGNVTSGTASGGGSFAQTPTVEASRPAVPVVAAQRGQIVTAAPAMPRNLPAIDTTIEARQYDNSSAVADVSPTGWKTVPANVPQPANSSPVAELDSSSLTFAEQDPLLISDTEPVVIRPEVAEFPPLEPTAPPEVAGSAPQFYQVANSQRRSEAAPENCEEAPIADLYIPPPLMIQEQNDSDLGPPVVAPATTVQTQDRGDSLNGPVANSDVWQNDDAASHLNGELSQPSIEEPADQFAVETPPVFEDVLIEEAPMPEGRESSELTRSGDDQVAVGHLEDAAVQHEEISPEDFRRESVLEMPEESLADEVEAGIQVASNRQPPVGRQALVEIPTIRAVPVNPNSDTPLTIKLEGPEKIFIGQPCEFHVLVENTSGDTLRRPFLNIFADSSIQPLDPSKFNQGAELLAPGQSMQVGFAMVASEAGRFPLVMRTGADGIEPDERSFSINTRLPLYNLSVSGPEIMNLGSEADFALRIENASAQPIEEIEIQLTLPEGMATTILDREADVDMMAGTIKWQLPVLKTGFSEIIRFRVRVSGRGDHESLVSVTTPAAPETESAFTTSVVSRTSLGVQIKDNPHTLPVGTPVGMEILVDNWGNEADHDVVLTLELPEGVTPYPDENFQLTGERTMQSRPFALPPGQGHSVIVNLAGESGGIKPIAARIHSNYSGSSNSDRSELLFHAGLSPDEQRVRQRISRSLEQVNPRR
ncbi:MAG: hypothetical protein AAF456_12685 [Planctomycetota bacterium]